MNAVLAQPADLNAKGSSGDTAIHTAVSKVYDNVVRLLAERRAMLNIKNNLGRTPLALLIARRPPPQQSLIEFLRGMGAE